MTFDALLSRLGLAPLNSGVCGAEWLAKPAGAELASLNPSTGEPMARVLTASRADYEQTVHDAQAAFRRWRLMPAPARGEIVRQLGLALREHKSDLGLLVTLETGKIRSEGEGEVQEMIDMCDFAVGSVAAALRPDDRQRAAAAPACIEQWHPLGPVGVITAFNFPVAVWAWNAALAAVCGDTVVWKPSPQTPLTAIAVQHIVNEVHGSARSARRASTSASATAEVGERMAADRRLPLISATGSCAMGREVAAAVGRRLGRSLLELGGNNAMIVTRVGQSRPGPAGRRLRGRRHRRPALHDAAAADRSRVDRRGVHRPAAPSLWQSSRSAIRGRTACSWAR